VEGVKITVHAADFGGLYFSPAPLFPLRLCGVLPDYSINTLGRHTAAGF